MTGNQSDRWPAEVAHLPVCPRRGLPIPYIAEITPSGTGLFGVLDPKRHRECLEGRLCAMCGLPMPGEVALLGDVVSLRPDGFYIEPPVHERCGELALGGLCPFISRERVPRRPITDEGILVIGSRDGLAEVGRTVHKRPMVMAIARDYEMGSFVTGQGHMPVYLARGVLRVRRYEWRDGVAAEVQQEPAPERERERTVRQQPRRKQPRSKR